MQIYEWHTNTANNYSWHSNEFVDSYYIREEERRTWLKLNENQTNQSEVY